MGCAMHSVQGQGGCNAGMDSMQTDITCGFGMETALQDVTGDMVWSLLDHGYAESTCETLLSEDNC